MGDGMGLWLRMSRLRGLERGCCGISRSRLNYRRKVERHHVHASLIQTQELNSLSPVKDPEIEASDEDVTRWLGHCHEKRDVSGSQVVAQSGDATTGRGENGPVRLDKLARRLRLDLTPHFGTCHKVPVHSRLSSRVHPMRRSLATSWLGS